MAANSLADAQLAAIPVQRLGASARGAYLAHLLALEDHDVRLRFGARLPPAAIEKYVEAIDFGGAALSRRLPLDRWPLVCATRRRNSYMLLGDRLVLRRVPTMHIPVIVLMGAAPCVTC